MKPVNLLAIFILSIALIKDPAAIEQNEKFHSTALLTDPRKSAPRTITVSNVQELYTAVNGPLDDGKGNEGVIIIVKPGLYVLSAYRLGVNKNMISRHNMGRIEFQQDMEIQGYLEKNATQVIVQEKVIIDGSGLPESSFAVGGESEGSVLRTGFIRMGRGKNVLAHLTVIGNTLERKGIDGTEAVALSAIDTDLCNVQVENVFDCTSAIVRIEDVLVIGGQTGINIRNGGTRSIKRNLTAYLYNNELKEMKTGGGQGITIQNSTGASLATINVEMKGNLSHKNVVGMRVMNQSVSSGKITILSVDDRFVENDGNGILFYGGMYVTEDIKHYAHYNSITFNGYNTHVKDNKGKTVRLAQGGGIFIVGGSTARISNRTSSNTVNLFFSSPVFSNNIGGKKIKCDIKGYAARFDAKPSERAGDSNSVNIILEKPSAFIQSIFHETPGLFGPNTIVLTTK